MEACCRKPVPRNVAEAEVKGTEPATFFIIGNAAASATAAATAGATDALDLRSHRTAAWLLYVAHGI